MKSEYEFRWRRLIVDVDFFCIGLGAGVTFSSSTAFVNIPFVLIVFCWRKPKKICPTGE